LAMPKEFRAYLLDRNSHIVKAIDLQAEDDAEASDAVLDLAKNGDVEVWEGSRLVSASRRLNKRTNVRHQNSLPTFKVFGEEAHCRRIQSPRALRRSNTTNAKSSSRFRRPRSHGNWSAALGRRTRFISREGSIIQRLGRLPGAFGSIPERLEIRPRR